MNGLKDEIFVTELSESGSLSVDTPNTGVVSARLIRPVYNFKEMVRSIDTQFTELVKDTQETKVLQTIYDEASERIKILENENKILNEQITNIQKEISITNREKSALEQELTTKNQVIRNLESRVAASNNQMEELVQQFQNALSGMGGDFEFDGGVSGDGQDVLITPSINITIKVSENPDDETYSARLECKLLNIDMGDIREIGYVYGSGTGIDLSDNQGVIEDVGVIDNTFIYSFNISNYTGNKYYRGYAISKDGKVGYSPSRYITKVDTNGGINIGDINPDIINPDMGGSGGRPDITEDQTAM